MALDVRPEGVDERREERFQTVDVRLGESEHGVEVEGGGLVLDEVDGRRTDDVRPPAADERADRADVETGRRAVDRRPVRQLDDAAQPSTTAADATVQHVAHQRSHHRRRRQLQRRIDEMAYTSQTGLYRYRTGDIVNIVNFFSQSPSRL